MSENTIINDKLSDHESRLRKLEENSTEMKLELANIKNELKDVKLIMMDFTKSQTELLTKFINNSLDTKSTNNKNTWELIFKIGMGMGVIANGIVTFYLK